ncbi:MAG: response regulator [Phycisphaerales bacterium]|nr:MAG: response regulator [Phycisphaerales bacterium]
MQNSKPILLVEDDSVDVMTVKRALKDLEVASELVPAGDGEEALAYLADDGNAKPSIILLDLNMPKMNGMEFLKIIKVDDRLKKIPVIVLTTSNSEQDIAESFELGAAGYMVKSVDYKRFTEIIKTIDSYWNLSKLPQNGE